MAQEQAKEKPFPIAFIDTNVFTDEKDGIAVYVKAIKNVESVIFRINRVSHSIKAKIESIENEIKISGSTISIETLKAKQEEITRLQREYDKAEKEFKELFQKTKREHLAPIEENIRKELADFAKQHGYKVVLDISKLYDAIIIWNPDPCIITKEFIAHFNAKHPVTNSQTQVKLSEPR